MIPAQYPSGKSNLPILCVSAASFTAETQRHRESRAKASKVERGQARAADTVALCCSICVSSVTKYGGVSSIAPCRFKMS